MYLILSGSLLTSTVKLFLVVLRAFCIPNMQNDDVALAKIFQEQERAFLALARSNMYVFELFS